MIRVYLYIDPEKKTRDHTWQHEMGQRLLSWASELGENSELKNTNISHSGGLVALALSDVPVGVDVERKRSVKQKVSEKAFTERERQYLEKKGDDTMSFLQLWTLKESYGKAGGVGIGYPLKDVEFIPPWESPRGAWAHIACSEGSVRCYSFLAEDYVLSVCAQSLCEEIPDLELLQNSAWM